MAHKLRKETDCLNCGAHINGQFCSVCGQENIEPKETLWDIIKHFFEDITHYDGQVFSLLKNIFLKPGKVSQEYIIGKRKSYINPIRMYIFTSLVFFTLVYSTTHKSILNNKNNVEMGFGSNKKDSLQKIENKLFIDSLRKIYKEPVSDSALLLIKDSLAILKNQNSLINIFYEVNDTLNLEFEEKEILKEKLDKKKEKKKEEKLAKKSNKLASIILDKKINSDFFTAKLDSFSKEYKLSYAEKRLYKKFTSIAYEKNYNKSDVIVTYIEIAIKNIPNILFLSIPIVALLFSLFFITSKINYAGHIIFIIHQYILIFIVGILLLLIYKIFPNFISVNIVMLSITGVIIHFLFAFRRFYGNRWFIILLKSFILFFILTFLFCFLLLILLLFVAI